MTLELAFNIVMGLVASLLGLTLKNLYAKIDKDRVDFDSFKESLTKEITDIKVEYLPKAELNRHQDQIMDSLKELTRKVDKLDDKISQKADK